jgi:hypothetical protein
MHDLYLALFVSNREPVHSWTANPRKPRHAAATVSSARHATRGYARLLFY